MGNRPSLLRRQLLIDKDIQLPLLTYSIGMASVGVVIAAAFGVLWNFSLQYEQPLWLSPALFIAGILISYSVMIFLGLYVTNRVAGPLHRLRAHMKSVADGNNPGPLSPREDDHISQDLFKEYNRLLNTLPQTPAKPSEQ